MVGRNLYQTQHPSFTSDCVNDSQEETDGDVMLETDWGGDDATMLATGPTAIQVCLRLRPMTRLERNRRSRSCIEVDEDSRNFTVDSPLDGEYDFCFDHVSSGLLSH